MRRLTFFCLLVAVIPGYMLFGQEEAVKLIDEVNHYKRIHASGSLHSLTYEDIQGSPYFYPDYRESRVFMKDGSLYKGKLRYDLYADEMEYQSDGQTYWIDEPENIEKVVLDTDTFIYLIPEGRKKGSWYQLLADGPYRLLARHRVSFNDAQPAKPYQDPVPANFKRKPESYYLQQTGHFPVDVSSKKSVVAFFGDRKGTVTSYIKKNHLNVRRTEDLQKLVHFINQQ